ncbi:MAG: Phospholipase D-nuclease N-terminal [Verrucomicrobiales bacterium]|nr:Phospholipase D-nuclease N-terminal [Verrucomicrobiales bacterium]
MIALPLVMIALLFAALAVAGAVVILVLPFLASALGLVFALLPLAFTIIGIVSCVNSRKSMNLKVLWLIIIVLAPFFGPLLWFVWGKNNT